MQKKGAGKMVQDEPKKSKKTGKQVVNASDILEEVILVEDPEIRGIQEETLSDDITDEGLGESEAGSLRQAQLGALVDGTVAPLDEDLEKKQLQKVMGNKTITYNDDEDTAKEMWNVYFE